MSWRVTWLGLRGVSKCSVPGFGIHSQAPPVPGTCLVLFLRLIFRPTWASSQHGSQLLSVSFWKPRRRLLQSQEVMCVTFVLCDSARLRRGALICFSMGQVARSKQLHQAVPSVPITIQQDNCYLNLKQNKTFFFICEFSLINRKNSSISSYD